MPEIGSAVLDVRGDVVGLEQQIAEPGLFVLADQFAALRREGVRRDAGLLEPSAQLFEDAALRDGNDNGVSVASRHR